MPKDQIMEAIYRESNGVNSRLALILCFAVFGVCRVFSVKQHAKLSTEYEEASKGHACWENLVVVVPYLIQNFQGTDTNSESVKRRVNSGLATSCTGATRERVSS